MEISLRVKINKSYNKVLFYEVYHRYILYIEKFTFLNSYTT